MEPLKATIVIPAFNEESNIEAVINEVKKNCSDFVNEIIVVNDASTDNTAKILSNLDVKAITHNVNKGYGASLKTGILNANNEYIFTVDGDGQHRATDIINIWQNKKESDLIIGKREDPFHSPMWRLPGKWLIKHLANYLLQTKVPDINSGLRLIKKSTISKYLHICPNGFSFSTTSTMIFINRGYGVSFFPIKVRKRENSKSTVKISTGFATILLILRITTLFSPLRIFLPTSIIFATIGLIWGIPILLSGHGVSTGSLLAIITSINLLMLGLLSDQISQLRLERFE